MCPYSAETVSVRAPKLASRLRVQLKLSGRNLRDLAASSGVNKGTISSWTQDPEDGKVRSVQIEAVARLARELGVDVEFLLDLPPGGHPPVQAIEGDLLGRVSSLSTRAAELEDPADELSEALQEKLGHVTRLSLLLSELRELSAEARRIAAQPPDPPDP